MSTKQISKINYNGETYQLVDETISSTYALIGHNHPLSDIAGIAFDGTYDMATNPIATVETVSTALSSITASSLGIGDVLTFIGFATSTMSDGQTSTPTISGKASYTPKVGDVVIDKASTLEYLYTTANKWEQLGQDGSFVMVGTEVAFVPGGTISSADAATGSNYTPKGSISTQSFYGTSTDISVTGTPQGSVVINSITPTGTISATFSGTQQTVQFSGTTDGIAVTAHSYTPQGTISSSTTGTINYTPAGTIKINDDNTIQVIGTASGTITSTFTGNGVRLVGTFTGSQGSVSVSGTTAGVAATVSTSTTSIPKITMTVNNEVLTYSSANSTVVTGVEVGIEQGTVAATGNFTPSGSVTIATGTGTANYTPSGTITSTFIGEDFVSSGTIAATFSGTGARLIFSGTASSLSHAVEQGSIIGSASFTPSGTISAVFTGSAITPTASFQGEDFAAVGSITPTGTIQQAVFTGSGALFTFTGSTTTITIGA